jgi:hypothetical protein
MLDFLFTLGQAASALLIIYGAWLVVLPQRKPAQVAELEGQPLLRHS